MAWPTSMFTSAGQSGFQANRYNQGSGGSGMGWAEAAVAMAGFAMQGLGMWLGGGGEVTHVDCVFGCLEEWRMQCKGCKTFALRYVPTV